MLSAVMHVVLVPLATRLNRKRPHLHYVRAGQIWPEASVSVLSFRPLTVTWTTEVMADKENERAAQIEPLRLIATAAMP